MTILVGVILGVVLIAPVILVERTIRVRWQPNSRLGQWLRWLVLDA